MRGQGREPDGRWDWHEVLGSCARLARRYVSDADADDVAQEAMLRAWRFRHTLRDAERVGPWLATIVRNEAFRLRSRSRPESMVETDIAGATDPAIDAVIHRDELEEALRHLDPLDRQLLTLRYDQDLTQNAIARVLEMPEGTVKVRLHRARAKLGQALSRP